MIKRKQQIETQIIQALSHPEAEEGLYFWNFTNLHEEDERQMVDGNEIEILDALRDLIKKKKIRMDDNGKDVVFFLEEDVQDSVR